MKADDFFASRRAPLPTVDIIITFGQSGIVLIERANEPRGWALPGGFVDYNETLESAAYREAFEETSLELTDLRQFRAYSDPARDARFHTISYVFIARGSGEPKGGSDASRAAIFPLDELPELVFDHKAIIEDFRRIERTPS